MVELNRRDFLKASGLAGLGLLGAGPALALTKLVPLEEGPKPEVEYNGWQDIYRAKLGYDDVGYSAHCVNCHGNCAFRVMVRDGVVVREEQLARYPHIVDGIPDVNPRGCQKGAVHSDSMYATDRLLHPIKRVGERGEGKWRRISWDQATEEIAAAIIDIYEDFGPGKLMTHTGTGTVSGGRMAAGYRFASLVGGVQADTITDVGDCNTGAQLAYGDAIQSFTSDAWFEADYIMLTLFNPTATRIPDAHYLSEARYRGARVVSVVPDYNPSAIHADLWIGINPGTDPYFFMSIVQTLLEEELWEADFVKEQTDLPLLVRNDTGKLLRQADLQPGGRDDVFYVWDVITGKSVEAPGSTGSETRTIRLDGVDPALEGSFEVNGISVEPSFVRVRAEAMKFRPEDTEEITGVRPATVRNEARLIARAKKLCMLDGFPVGKLVNGIYIGWSQALICALTGNGGPRGGIDTSWIDDGWPATFRLAFMDFKKMPRLEAGGLGEFLRGEKMVEARLHYDQQKLKERAGFDLDELQTMIDESVATRQMPYYGPVKGLISIADNKFTRNKGPRYRERILRELERIFVSINTRIDSTAMWADYVLPAASHYESWDVRKTPLHRFVNLFTAPVKPLGESRPDWEIMELLTKKIQEASVARGIGSYPDGPVTRDFDTIHDDFTMDGKLMTARDEVEWIVANSPELKGQTFEEGAEKGFLTVYESPWPASTIVERGKTINPWEKQVLHKEPYPTLSGRITFYCDHDWFQKLDSTVPTARLNAGRGASRYPYTFYTPHTRWGIHTNWRANEYMLRLQRGEPIVYLNPGLASGKQIADGDRVRIFNGVGEFFAKAKLTPVVREDQVTMEHAWERYQFEGQAGLNNVVATLIQPLELVGDWGQLKFSLNRWNPNQVANESSVDVERAALLSGGVS